MGKLLQLVDRYPAKQLGHGFKSSLMQPRNKPIEPRRPQGSRVDGHEPGRIKDEQLHRVVEREELVFRRLHTLYLITKGSSALKAGKLPCSLSFYVPSSTKTPIETRIQYVSVDGKR